MAKNKKKVTFNPQIASAAAAAASSGQTDPNITLPRVLPPVGAAMPLPPGLYILPGATGQGKTVTTVAWHLMNKSMGGKSAYRTVFEPGVADNAVLAAPLDWEAWLDKELKNASGGHLFIDSMHFTLALLPSVAAMADTLGTTTFSGGLRLLEFFGTAAYNAKAVKNNVALIGCFNSTVLPIADKYEASAAGLITLGSPGSLRVRARGVEGRDFTDFTVDASAVEAALTMVHSTKTLQKGYSRI